MTPRTQTGLTPATGEAFQPVITSEKGREEDYIKEEKKKKNNPKLFAYSICCFVRSTQSRGCHRLRAGTHEGNIIRVFHNLHPPQRRQHFHPLNSHEGTEQPRAGYSQTPAEALQPGLVPFTAQPHQHLQDRHGLSEDLQGFPGL